MNVSKVAVVFGLLFPMSAHAQTVALKDIVGVWTRQVARAEVLPFVMGNQSIPMKGKTTASDTLSFQADSTFHWGSSATLADGMRQAQHWNYLRGDTLSFSKNGACTTTAGGRNCADCPEPSVTNKKVPDECLHGEPGFKIAVKDQQLILTAVGGTQSWEAGTYTRVASPKQNP